MNPQRREFSPKTKRQALERSEGLCEAEGLMYGLRDGERCEALLEDAGVEYDHILECWLGGGNGIDNCAAICPACHLRKSSRYKGAKAKIDRITGVTGKRKPGRRQHKWPSQKIPSRPFFKKGS